jgi:hypothetical protein
VTGYDAESIYINDAVWPDGWGHPTDPRDPRFKNMKMPVGEFMQAWEKTRDFGPYGPYWMLFIEQTNGAQLNKESVSHVLAMQKDLSRNVAADIDKYAGSDISGTEWRSLEAVRRLFGDYLVTHGHTEAGALYRSLANDYDMCAGMSSSDARAMLIGTIKTKEIEARSKY